MNLIKAYTFKINIPFKNYLSKANIKRKILTLKKELKTLKVNVYEKEKKVDEIYGLQMLLDSFNRKDFKKKSLDIEIQVFIIGNLVIIGFPGELFNEIEEKLQDRLSPLNVIVIGYANDYIGYIATEDSYEEGGYEVFASEFVPGAEKIIINGIKDFIEKNCKEVFEHAGCY